MKSKEKNKKRGSIAENVIILILIVFLILDVSWFYKGFHNVDLYKNSLKISQDITKATAGGVYATNITDTGLNGINMPIEEYYRNGMFQMDSSFILGMIDLLALGLLLGRKFEY